MCPGDIFPGKETSSDRSATLGDTSWVRLIVHPYSQLHKESKTQPILAKAQNYIGGDTAHTKCILSGTLSEQGDKWSRIFLQISPSLQVFNQTPSNLWRDLQGWSPAYGKLEQLINKLVYKYYKDYRQDKAKTKAISTALIMITT